MYQQSGIISGCLPTTIVRGESVLSAVRFVEADLLLSRCWTVGVLRRI